MRGNSPSDTPMGKFPLRHPDGEIPPPTPRWGKFPLRHPDGEIPPPTPPFGS